MNRLVMVMSGLLLAVPAAAVAQSTVPAPPSGNVAEAIRLQQLVKKRYLELTRIMGEVSRRLEATDPKTAAAISAAAQRAEAAAIAGDMDKVIVLLQNGLIVPADVTQGKVILRLREVLNALRGEDGLEWRLFILQELQEQMADLTLLIQRQQVLERQSRMLGFGEQMKKAFIEGRTRIEALAGRQEAILGRTRDLTPSPAAMEFTGVRQGMGGIIRQFDTARDELWNPTPPPDQLARNIVAIRRYHAQTVTLRTDLRTLFNSDTVLRAVESLPAGRRGQHVVDSVGKAADELDRSAKAMAANDLKEGLLSLSEAKALLRESLAALDETLQGFGDVQPAVRITADQKAMDDDITKAEPLMRELFPGGLAAIDDSPAGNERVTEWSDRLTTRPSAWAAQSPVLLALDPAGTAARQEQSLTRLRDWVSRLEEGLGDIDRLKDDPRYPAQKKEQDGITTDLRSILDINKRRAETVENDAELTAIFSVLRTAIENAADASGKAAGYLEKELPRDANPRQNDVIHFLTTVRDRVGPELKMDKNKYAMNEQMLARIQRMIIKQRICLAQAKTVWDKRGKDGSFGRTESLLIEAIARDQGSLEDDFKMCWEIMNLAHNVGFGLFPPEARMMLELARAEVQEIVKRLQKYDPGAQTQRMQEVVIERLKVIASLLSDSSIPSPPELDRQFTYDSFVSRMNLHNTRVQILALLAQMQNDINRRTTMIDNARRAGTASAAMEQEVEQIRLLQEHVRVKLAGYAEQDARSWMGPERIRKIQHVYDH